ncbi:putative enzyme related to lactoylglutathione lyase [Agrobacterium sp. DSM 25558]|uniref:VOC family protein n=1 Tax=Agrobacterium sp. DSM 25558 TaxID=1907665 RepID=UPI0009725823|nr:VOC family protein [Agrobacterium sp. DSM 25558]SCX13727.1 putative enzyme related to lactoylglutathione lyase [Agrobacterium sp. DSM 25558]
MTHPNFTILFVDNPVKSTEFYQDLFGIAPVEASETFALFILQGGLKFGLWSRHTAEPAVTVSGGGAEIVFQVDQDGDVDARHRDWKAKGLAILQEPTAMDFGYTFLATDPDGHRLRVYSVHD